MRIIFMGTPEFSCVALDALFKAAHDIVAVYSQPPRRAGRGKQMRPSAVHNRALELGLPVHTPVDFNNPDCVRAFEALGADVAVVVAYGLILPRAVLDAPRLGCLNIHASLLPRWRGAAPIERALMAGDDQSGICIMLMEAELDAGPVLLRDKSPIRPDDTGGRLHDRLAMQGAGLIVQALDTFENLVPVAQSDQGITYAAKITKAEARINWSQPAPMVDAHIRALSPFPGAWFNHDGQRIKVTNCQVVQGMGAAGSVLDDKLTVACGRGALRLTKLQRAGRGVMGADDFLRGFAIPAGTMLGSGDGA